MSELDRIKEQIAYLKFWLGVMVVTDLSLVGWLISNAGEEPRYKVLGALAVIAIITLSGFAVHRGIGRRIDALEGL